MPKWDKDKWTKEGPGGAAGRSNCYNYALDMPATTDQGKKLQPGQQNGHTLKTPYTCDDVTEGAKKDGLTLSDKKATCNKGCWKVALFICPPNGESTVGDGGDFHWYRQDDDGSWSHKLDGHDPSQEDNAGKKITDPEKADTGKYKFCNYFCVCPTEVQKKVKVAMTQPLKGPPYVLATLKEPALLVSRGIDLELPPGRICIVYVDSGTQGVTLSGMFTSGAENPSWALSAEDAAVFHASISALSPSKRVPRPRIGVAGFRIESPFEGADRPPVVKVYDGIVSIWSPDWTVQRFEDAGGLTDWLATVARKGPFADRMPGDPGKTRA